MVKNAAMEPKCQIVLEQALSLSAEERAELVGAQLKSSEPSAETDIESEWRAEISARIHAADTSGARPIPWQRIRDQLYARLSERRSA